MSLPSTGRAASIRRRTFAVLAIALTVVLSACGVSIPRDPDGTLDRVTHGELRVGWTPEPGLVDDDPPAPSGPLPDLVEGFAHSIDAETVWTMASEESLVGMLESGDLDLAIGGFTDQTPWTDRAGVTRGYTKLGDRAAPPVLLVPLGENAFLTALETYLDDEVGS